MHFAPASFRPDSARKKPATPNTSATMACAARWQLYPSTRNDIAPEYTLRAFAQTAPSAIASSVTSASGVARWLVKPAVGLVPNLVLLVTVAAAAPTISSTTHESRTPRPPHSRGPAVRVRRQITRVVAARGSSPPHNRMRRRTARASRRLHQEALGRGAPGFAFVKITTDAIKKTTTRNGRISARRCARSCARRTPQRSARSR